MNTIFDDIYTEPDAVWTRETPHEAVKKVLKRYDVPQGKGVDIGCGEGYNTRYLAQQG